MWHISYIFYVYSVKKVTLNILYLVLYSARSWMWQISFIFQVLKVKIVKCDHHFSSLSRTLFSTQQSDILDFFSLKSEKSQLWSFSISYSFRHAREMWQTSYIFQALKVKIVKCDHFLSHTLFGTQQKYDIHCRTLFWVLSRTLFGTQPKFDIHRTPSFLWFTQ